MWQWMTDLYFIRAAIIFFHNEGRNIILNHARISFVHIFIVRSETHHSFNLTTYKFSLSAYETVR